MKNRILELYLIEIALIEICNHIQVDASKLDMKYISWRMKSLFAFDVTLVEIQTPSKDVTFQVTLKADEVYTITINIDS